MADAPDALRPNRGIAGTVLLLALAAVWSIVAAAVSGGGVAGQVALIAASAVSLFASATISRRTPWFTPAAVVAIATALVPWALPAVLSPRPLDGPFGYANATAAFYLQATIAALIAAIAVRDKRAKAVFGFGAAAFAALVLASGSAAATAMLLAPAVVLAARPPRFERPAAFGLAGLFAAVLVVTIVIGAGYRGATPEEPARDRSRRAERGVLAGERFPDQRRQALWHEALMLIGNHPIAGVGPGNFSTLSPTARSDDDARRAHHGFLQFGAETGLPGLILLGLAFTWPVGWLAASSRRPGTLRLLGASAVVVFGAGACVDYLMHFPGLTLTAAALAGVTNHATE